MNVVEKFLEKFNQCIILLSGFEQLQLSEYAKNLADNFNFNIVKFNYPNYNILNDEVIKKSSKGVIVYGLTFEKDKLNFKTNYHISLSSHKSIINDDEKYKIYTEHVKDNFINKFKNVKTIEYDNNTYDDIFNLCIDMIMRRVYGDRYEEAQKKYAELNLKTEPITPNNDDSENEDIEEIDERQKITEQSGGKKRKNGKKIIGTRLVMSRIKLKN